MYRTAKTKNAKFTFFQGLSQHRINKKYVCIHGQSVKQHVQNGPRTVDFVLDGIAHFVFSLLAVQYI